MRPLDQNGRLQSSGIILKLVLIQTLQMLLINKIQIVFSLKGYYLKGIANDVLLKFEDAIDLFLKALVLEKEHSNIIIKNLIKTVYKFISKQENQDFNDKIDAGSKSFLVIEQK
jgi:hypothetical protein